MTDENISMVRGNTLAFGMEFEGLDQDLESAYFTCRASYDAENYIFQKSLGSGISKVETGKYRVRVAPEDTDDVVSGRYFYDLQIGLNGDLFTILKGVLDIQPNVTLGGAV